MGDSISIFWFRRDLRLVDNVGLYHALASGKPILPLFIFDTQITNLLNVEDARISFIYKQLRTMHEFLQKDGAGMCIKQGVVSAVFEELIATYRIAEVYTNHDYEPYAKERDQAIKSLLAAHNIPLNSYKDQVIFERDEITKKDGLPYTIYSPYAKQWMLKLTASSYSNRDTQNDKTNFTKINFPFPTLNALGFRSSKAKVLDFDLSDNVINNYADVRDFPAIDQTSKLSPHLRFGTISIRKCVQKAIDCKDKTFLKELIWREFFMQILYHFPKVVNNNFKSKYDGIVWRNNKGEFDRWCRGMTGYPMVDAGMRELNKTGYMHNRVRMVVASFLCKHLLIDWRWGAAYFAQRLVDYDLSANNGNWQWAAGTGCDAAPYFRVFNPLIQAKKFDPQLKYINYWIPELGTAKYPSPIVEHKMARLRAIETYKRGLE
ncbi:cryptochrome/photolyase family protein [Aureispira anguillae]|uniref:DNA photolyase family protein n=1 Tax=Aureispira anguillae TaxID=2864201 RepID=A0A915YCP5_9BACT|nr:deoxyribodipyrimidine photo-lyase [Aureispira anguillae]BDS10650.1 DNA photolyase family protein [Aureispira anguillae]